MSEDLRKPRIYPRRIIERPRLIQELESSSARIILLVAGPGYGKTVLAEQWATADSSRTVGWFRARSSSADVSVVARGLVEAAGVVVPGVGARLLERLSVTEDPEREAALLGEMLAEDLGEWPDTGWVAIDDSQSLASSAAADDFLATVVCNSSVRVLIAGTETPMWIRDNTVTHVSVIEIGAKALAMTAEETNALMRGTSAAGGKFRDGRAGGWPILVGLASMLPDASAPELSSRGALFDFYSKTLIGALEPALSAGLVALAELPRLDRDLIAFVLGVGRGHEVCTELIELGILDEREGLLELHPLLSAFLARTSVNLNSQFLVVASALALYRDRRDWDSAFEVIRRHALDEELGNLVLEAVDELLYSGRLSTIEDWVRFARIRGVSPHPVFEIAEIELHLRHGRFATALTYARSAIENSHAAGDFVYRLCMVAGRSAHGDAHDEEALRFYRRARELGRSTSQEREARWGEVMCMSVLERPESQDLLDELVASVVGSDARDQVRMADRQLSVGFRFGFVRNLSDSRRAAELVEHVDDPFVRCSFLTVHAWALTLGAHYQEALAITEKLLSDAMKLRVDPVLPYAHSTRAIVFAGLRRRDQAIDAVEQAEREARRINDQTGLQNGYATKMRVLLQAGRALEACATEPPDVSQAIRSTRGEVLGSRALALATIGRIDEAAGLTEEARGHSGAIETRALCAAVAATCALKQRTDDLMDRCETLIEHGFETGSVDFAVTAYRANPELLATLLASRKVRDKAVYLVHRAGDEALVEALGFSSLEAVDPTTSLSSREREVYQLVCEGLSNGEIGRRLFITPSTVKAHLHHVFDKLGIRSRNALALNAASGRYATSAAIESSASDATGGATEPKP